MLLILVQLYCTTVLYYLYTIVHTVGIPNSTATVQWIAIVKQLKNKQLRLLI